VEGVELSLPVIDFAHIYKELERINGYEELRNMHIHMSSMEYGPPR